MKTETHLRFAEKLAEKYLFDLNKFDRRMFILGSVTPDINPFSYLKGIFIKPFFGHNWPNRRAYILSHAEDLQNGRLSPFKAGQLIHYLSDAFTHTHNINYHGGLKAHTLYEKELHSHFHSLNVENSLPNITDSLPDIIVELHRQYISLPPSLENDLKFITTAVHCALMHGIPHARKQPTMPINTAR